MSAPRTSLVLDEASLRRSARAHGLDAVAAHHFARLALQTLRQTAARPLSARQLAAAMRQQARREAEADDEPAQPEVAIVEQQETASRSGARRRRFVFSPAGLALYLGTDQDPYQPLDDETGPVPAAAPRFDLVGALCRHVELAVEVGKHLGPEDLLALYALSRDFHSVVNSHLLSTVRAWIGHQAPEAGRVFAFQLYRRLLVADPAGRAWDLGVGAAEEEEEEGGGGGGPGPVRSVPGMAYLQLVLVRDRCCRQIRALMARHGHRMPAETQTALLRLWQLMEVATSRQRRALVRNARLWPDVQLYNAQLFFVKLSMLFNEPLQGAMSLEMVQLMLGQRGLYPLWQLLFRRRFRTAPEVLQAKVAYDGGPGPAPAEHLYGVPVAAVGAGHREGWGAGPDHLLRPDELVAHEAVARGLRLDDHLAYMLTWGYLDWTTGENVVPTEAEMQLSDEERVLEAVDAAHLWQRKHALKKRWPDLTPAQRQAIADEDEDDRVRALAWTVAGDEGDDDDDDDDDDDGPDAPYSPEDEISRGYILRRPPADQPASPVAVPAADDAAGWRRFVNEALLTLPPDLPGEDGYEAGDDAAAAADDDDDQDEDGEEDEQDEQDEEEDEQDEDEDEQYEDEDEDEQDEQEDEDEDEQDEQEDEDEDMLDAWLDDHLFHYDPL